MLERRCIEPLSMVGLTIGTTRGLICITVKSVLEKVALRQLFDASCGPRKSEKNTTYGSMT